MSTPAPSRELRDRLVAVLHAEDCGCSSVPTDDFGPEGHADYLALADAVLAIPAIRRALATQAEEDAFIASLPAIEDDPVAMRLGFVPVKEGVRLPGTPEHCHQCALDEIERLRAVVADQSTPAPRRSGS